MLRFCETKVSKEEFYDAKQPTQIWVTDVDNIVISKLIETKNNSKYLIGCLDDVTRPLVLILHLLSEYVKNLKDKNGNKDENKNNKFISFLTDDEKPLEKYKII